MPMLLCVRYVLADPCIVYLCLSISVFASPPPRIGRSQLVYFHAQVSLCQPSYLSSPCLVNFYWPGIFGPTCVLVDPCLVYCHAQLSLWLPSYWSIPLSCILPPRCLCVLFYPYWSTPVSCFFMPRCLCVRPRVCRPQYRVFFMPRCLCVRPVFVDPCIVYF